MIQEFNRTFFSKKYRQLGHHWIALATEILNMGLEARYVRRVPRLEDIIIIIRMDEKDLRKICEMKA